ncbi:transcriptional regulator, TetR family [Glycomyces sambucus]|uniref:Transcriptional regulator, TetR family n=1 Tax=Glycomyces sambucus TaxID=380244 RepID=A0A1G9I7A2_9ACTN|nr:TetR/AcrR family transcriptional regulator [Glycomyces sambucus]SDL21109.1 transcriptional regulator, TetR family [Glycomyces sambucus]
MPRGIAIPQLRQHLFAAAETVVLRGGPTGLTGRAVTVEAGVAAGLLYRHFADFDAFLAAYAVDRSFTLAAAPALTERVGTGEVAANLAGALTALPRPALTALARLLAMRPDLVPRIEDVLGAGGSGFDAIERAAAEYLAAERLQGRLPERADPAALALAAVGVLHRLVLAGRDLDRLRGVVDALVTAAAREGA